MDREHELALRLAEAQYTQAELRRVIDILIQEGDAVFASRSWRLGRAMTRWAERLLHWLGRGGSAAAQDSAHWRRIVAAHDDGLARRRALLEQLCRDEAPPQDLDALLEQLWRAAAAEDCVVQPMRQP